VENASQRNNLRTNHFLKERKERKEKEVRRQTLPKDTHTSPYLGFLKPIPSVEFISDSLTSVVCLELKVKGSVTLKLGV